MGASNPGPPTPHPDEVLASLEVDLTEWSDDEPLTRVSGRHVSRTVGSGESPWSSFRVSGGRGLSVPVVDMAGEDCRPSRRVVLQSARKQVRCIGLGRE